MTATKKRRTRLERRLRKIEALLALALVATTAALAISATVAGSSQPETPQTETRESAPRETKAPTEPLNAKSEAPEEEPAPRYDITAAELDIVARVVHTEARGEGFDGQALVAQCVLNTAEATGQRPDEVVLEPGQYAAPAEEASEEVKAAVAAVFLDGYKVTEEPVRWFYSPANTYSKWHETALEFVLEHGGHKFFKQ